MKPTYKLRKLSKGLVSITLAGAFMVAPFAPSVMTAFATEVTAPTFPTEVTDANVIAQDYITNYVNAFLNGGVTAATNYSNNWDNWAESYRNDSNSYNVIIDAIGTAATNLGYIYNIYNNTGYATLEQLDSHTKSLYDRIIASNRIWDTDDFKTTSTETTTPEEEKQAEAIVEGVDVTVTKPAGSLVFDDNGNFLGWGTPESYTAMTWDEFLAWEKTWSNGTSATNPSENTDTGSSDATTGEGSSPTEGTSSSQNQAEGSEVVTKTSDTPPTVDLPVAPVGKSSDQPPVVDLPVYDLDQASQTGDMTGTDTGSSQLGSSEVVTKTSDTPPTVDFPVAPVGKSSDQPPVVDLPVYALEQDVNDQEQVQATSPEVSKPVPSKDKVAPSTPVYQTGNTLPKTGDATSYLSLVGGGLLALARAINKGRRRHS